MHLFRQGKASPHLIDIWFSTEIFDKLTFLSTLDIIQHRGGIIMELCSGDIRKSEELMR